jgi:predicted TIM-barrel fold metal-dependent hydrolase
MVEPAATPTRKYHLIATEEAFATEAQFEGYRRLLKSPWNDPDLGLWKIVFEKVVKIADRCLDLDRERLQIMDANGVDMHVLSLTSPGVQQFDADTATALAADANDQLAAMVKRHPTRFAGLASFAPQDPARAAKEIDRAINKLGLHGLIVNSHTNSEYLDNHKFWPIFEAAVACNAAVYIHPRNPPAVVAEFLKAEVNLWNAIWGFQQETGLHAMRLIVSGIFDEFPKLKIVLGHMGEALPYWRYRMDFMYKVASGIYNTSGTGRPPLKRAPSEYLQNNFLITTSGMNDHAVLKYCDEVLGPDNIMYAIDYPWQGTEEAVRFINSAPLPPAHMEKITHGNAERAFHIKAAAGATEN